MDTLEKLTKRFDEGLYPLKPSVNRAKDYPLSMLKKRHLKGLPKEAQKRLLKKQLSLNSNTKPK